MFNALADGLFVLNAQFVPGSPQPPCRAAADADGNRQVNGLTDGLYILNAGFVPGSLPPPPPFQNCGNDPNGIAALGCAVPDPVCN